ncbi:hypothetical protein NL108_004612 [Boleophthalmus pectinirostris]|nr:hypothetical protein NL108_004612 [Boleophthalmus pectinirostris]
MVLTPPTEEKRTATGPTGGAEEEEEGKFERGHICGPKPFPAAMTIAVVASRSLRRAQEFAKKHGIPKAYGSYEELANDPDIDIVYIGVLHTQHWKVGLLFLKAGKNVLCEKPFAMNSRQVQDLVVEAKRSNVFLMEAIWSRCFPVHAEVRRLLAEKVVGEVKLVKAYFGSPQLHIPRSVEKELGGGALLDIGVYCLQFVLMVFRGEKPLSIQASGVLLDSGLKESPLMPLAESVLLTEIMDEIRKQVGVVFSQDNQ